VLIKIKCHIASSPVNASGATLSLAGLELYGELSQEGKRE
jgi:hypothetical protein